MSDDSQLERTMAVATAACSQLLGPSVRALFATAFRRDLSIAGYRTAGLFDELGIANRANPRASWLPGRVVIWADPSSSYERFDRDALAGFLDRGGTLIVEGNGIVDLAERCDVAVEAHPVTPGLCSIGGPAVRVPKPLAPLAWLDADARSATFANLPVDVLAATNDGTPLVSRVLVRRGSLIHVGWITAPFKRESELASSTTARRFAATLGVAASGVLATETEIDADQASAATTMIHVVVEIVASALGAPANLREKSA